MISGIVPVFNGREHLARLLDSLDRQTRPLDELLVIDNASTDGAPDLARARGARVIAMGRNTGFAPAVNRGIREAAGDRLAILNSDVVLAPDYLQLLEDAAVPFATGKILSPSGTLDATFDLTSRAGTTWRAGHGMADGPPFDRPYEITSPPFTAVLIYADIFRRAGLLDESYESYLEDAEFGLRCARLGITGRYLPEAHAVHAGSATLGRWHPDTVRRIARNQCFLAAKHVPRSCRWLVIWGQLLWGLVALRHGTGLAWLRGKYQGFRGCPSKEDIGVLEPILRSNEQFIRRYSPDSYWRLYFLLTPETK